MANIWQELKKPIFCLAPMFGVTDSAFRQLIAREKQYQLMMTEFVNVQALFSPDNKSIQQLTYITKEQPLIAQIWGADPELFEAAADFICRAGFSGIDINMGCPEKTVVKKGAGAALIDNHQLAGEIIQAAVKGAAGRLPVSVKTRIGYHRITTEAWIKFLLNFGLAAIAIHGRTAQAMSTGPVNWSELTRAVKLKNQAKSKTLIIVNGDLFTRQEAFAKIKLTGADGAMTGRGVFHYLKTKTRAEKLKLLKQHLDLYQKTWGQTKAYHPLKRFFKIYLSGFAGALKLRIKLMNTNSIAEARAIIG